MRRIIIAVALLAALGIGLWFAFGRGSAGPGGADDAPLAFVPRETPYVFANLEPFPATLAEHWLQQMDIGAKLWQAQLDAAIRTLEGTRPDATELKWLRAARAELEGKTMAQVFDALGYDLQGRFAFYGIGFAPVMRLTLADPARFRAFVARIEAAGGQALPRASVDGQEYWQLAAPDGKLRGILAVQGEHLVLTLAPAGDDDSLRVLLGLERPAEDMRDGRELVALNGDFGYLPYASGYVDSRRLAALLAAAPTPLEAAFLAALGTTRPAHDASCAADFERMAGALPRFSGGYTALDAKHMRMVSRIETSPGIAQDLMKLRAPMPGLAQAANAPFNLGLSLQLAQLPTVVNGWAGAVAAKPWQCPSLAWLNEGFASTRTQASNPVIFGAAPVFRGLHAIATRISFPAGSDTPDFGGKLLLGSPNPTALVAMAKSFAPALASLDLKPDGKVQPLPVLPDLPMQLPTWVAMNDTVLALAIGEGEDADLADYLATDASQQPLLVLGYSGELFARFNRQMLERAGDDANPEAAAAQKQSIEMISQLYAQIRRTELRIEFDERGVVMAQTADMN